VAECMIRFLIFNIFISIIIGILLTKQLLKNNLTNQMITIYGIYHLASFKKNYIVPLYIYYDCSFSFRNCPAPVHTDC